MGNRVGLLGVTALSIALVALAPGIRLGSRPGGALAGPAATQASPVPQAVEETSAKLPDGILVELLAAAELGGLPADSATLRLERVDLMPGESRTVRAGAAELLAIVDGDVAVATSGDDAIVAAGGQLVIPAGELYAVTAEGAGAALLRLTIDRPTDTALVASPVASPVPDAAPLLLISGDDIRLDSRRGTLFVARVELPGGVATGRQVFSGPVGVAVEAGALTVSADSMPDLTLRTGGNVVLPAFTAVDVASGGDEPATLLVAGVLAPATRSAVGPTVTASPAVDLVATAEARADALEGDVATLATREAELSRTVTAQQTAIASAEAAAAAVESDAAAGEAALATANAGLANAEATLEALSAELATVEAVATAAAGEADAAATAAAQASSALEATVVALQAQNTELANAQATSEAEAASAASAAAAEQTAAAATIVAQAEEIASANAAATAAAEAAASAASAAAASLGDAEATIAAQSAEIAAGNATATAAAAAAASAEAASASQLAAAEAEAAAAATFVAVAVATASANAAATQTALAGQVSAADAAAATASADAAAAQTALAGQVSAADAAAATAGAQIAAAEATIAAQSVQARDLESSLASAVAEAEAAAATIAALSTAQAETSSLAVASLNPNYIDVSIQIDLEGVIAGNAAAIATARDALETVLEPFEGCRAGVVLTFGHGNTIGQGTVLARALNAVVQERHPEIFGGAAFDNFGDLTAPLGQVDFRIYFFTGCPAAEGATPEP